MPPLTQISSKEKRHKKPLGGDTARFPRSSSLIDLSGQVLNNAISREKVKVPRKPDWIRAKVPGGAKYRELKGLVKELGLHTVCEEASCPNIGECWSRGTATIMILGEICTRNCGFCDVKTGKPLPPNPDEPRNVAIALSKLNLTHVVVTCVDRDDLPDGGASHWAATINAVHELCPNLSIEVLVGDFKGSLIDLNRVIKAKPEILAHNVETVKRMHPAVRPQASYERSIEVLERIHKAGLVAKTSLMVGIGEKDDEILETMLDIRKYAQTPILTIGQYLQPTTNHLPIDRWVHPKTFSLWKNEGLAMGFEIVESGPLVRSSYHAEEQAKKYAEISINGQARDL